MGELFSKPSDTRRNSKRSSADVIPPDKTHRQRSVRTEAMKPPERRDARAIPIEWKQRPPPQSWPRSDLNVYCVNNFVTNDRTDRAPWTQPCAPVATPSLLYPSPIGETSHFSQCVNPSMAFCRFVITMVSNSAIYPWCWCRLA